MNRRSFLFSAAAVPVCVLFGALAPIWPVNASENTQWLFVHRSERLARQLREWHGNPPNAHYIGAPGQLCGRGFDQIVMMPDWDQFFPSKAMRDDYYNCVIRTRLNLGGEIYHG